MMHTALHVLPRALFARVAALGLGCTASSAPTAVPVVVANDNRTPAGTMRDGVLRIELDVVTARWYPKAANGPFVDVAVFAESGKPPMVTATLIRVPLGTRVRLVVRNALKNGKRPVGGGHHRCRYRHCGCKPYT